MDADSLDPLALSLVIDAVVPLSWCTSAPLMLSLMGGAQSSRAKSRTTRDAAHSHGHMLPPILAGNDKGPAG